MSRKSLKHEVLVHRSAANTIGRQRNDLDEQDEQDRISDSVGDLDYLGRNSPTAFTTADILRLQRSIGNRAVASRIGSMPSAPSLQRAATTHYRPQQQQTNKGNHQNVIQRVGYDRLDGSCIVADVVENAGQIVMNGSLTRDPQNVDNIAAHLDYHAATVPLSKVDNDAFMGAYRTANALEITTVDAAPRGKRIGQILAYHLGLIAQRGNIEYIIAKNVTAARAPFYTPLGFRDALDEPLFADLLLEVTQIETAIRTDVNANIPQLLARKEAISGQNGLMAKNTIFIRTNDLIQNAGISFGAQWRAT